MLTTLNEMLSGILKLYVQLRIKANQMRSELEKVAQLEQTVKIKEKEVDSLNSQVRELKLKLGQIQTRLKESDENTSHLESIVSKLETRKRELKFEGKCCNEFLIFQNTLTV